MTPQEVKALTGRTVAEIARQIGCSGVHAARAFAGDGRVSLATLLKIQRETGLRVGRLKGATDEEVRILERYTVEAS